MSSTLLLLLDFFFLDYFKIKVLHLIPKDGSSHKKFHKYSFCLITSQNIFNAKTIHLAYSTFTVGQIKSPSPKQYWHTIQVHCDLFYNIWDAASCCILIKGHMEEFAPAMQEEHVLQIFIFHFHCK